MLRMDEGFKIVYGGLFESSCIGSLSFRLTQEHRRYLNMFQDLISNFDRRDIRRCFLQAKHLPRSGLSCPVPSPAQPRKRHTKRVPIREGLDCLLELQLSRLSLCARKTKGLCILCDAWLDSTNPKGSTYDNILPV